MRFAGSSPVTVDESFSAQVTPHHVSGLTTRAGQVVRVDCPLTVVYDVNEATGSAVLAQTVTVRLRSARLHRGTRYAVDCSDPVLLELPSTATNLAAAASSSTGMRADLPVSSPRGARADAGSRLVSIGWPATLPAGDYTLQLGFQLPDTRPFQEKAVFAAEVRCGRANYLAPLLPGTTDMRRVTAFGVDPSAGATSIVLPHIAGANALHATVNRKLRC